MYKYGRMLLLFMASLSAMAQPLTPSARVSLLTCTPGQELYSRYGHTAVRVRDDAIGLDYVFNYGLFSFSDPNFYGHFVQGNTWYELGVETYREFMVEYREEHRPVAEQVINLSDEEKRNLFHALMVNSMPENCKYLYNFVFDNCATRPYYMIKHVLGDSITSDYMGWEGRSYRDFIHHYTRHGSWAEFGINLVFGYKADHPVTGEGRLFLPEELMLYLRHAKRQDGSPVMSEQIITPFTPAPVPWYATWCFGVSVLALLLLVISVYDRHRGRRTRWVDWVLYVGYALMAALLVFLIFFSLHPLVSIGWRVFFIPFIHLCTRLVYILR